MKAFRIKFTFKFLAILDILLTKRFELTIYKNGKRSSLTRYWSEEIDDFCKTDKETSYEK